MNDWTNEHVAGYQPRRSTGSARHPPARASGSTSIAALLGCAAPVRQSVCRTRRCRPLAKAGIGVDRAGRVVIERSQLSYEVSIVTDLGEGCRRLVPLQDLQRLERERIGLRRSSCRPTPSRAERRGELEVAGGFDDRLAAERAGLGAAFRMLTVVLADDPAGRGGAEVAGEARRRRTARGTS